MRGIDAPGRDHRGVVGLLAWDLRVERRRELGEPPSGHLGAGLAGVEGLQGSHTATLGTELRTDESDDWPCGHGA